MIKAIAIHGDYATGETLRRDMGDPAWVDEYVTWRTIDDAITQLQHILHRKRAILIGYSRGADIVRRMRWHTSVVGLIGYEPYAEQAFNGWNNMPKLLITNTWGRGCWTRDGYTSNLRWLAAGAEHLEGRGFHVSPRFGWPPIGHAWDRRSNHKIGKWIERVKDAETA